MQIYLTRHGEDLPSRPGYLSGEDPALSDVGRQQAMAVAAKLRAALDTTQQLQILTSPCQRTTQTAQLIAAILGVDPGTVKMDARLTERDCAPFFGRLASEVFSLSEAELTRGGMEAYDAMYARLESLYAETLHDHLPTIFVTHSGNIRPLTQIAAQIAPDPTAPLPDLPADGYLQLCSA